MVPVVGEGWLGEETVEVSRPGRVQGTAHQVTGLRRLFFWLRGLVVGGPGIRGVIRRKWMLDKMSLNRLDTVTVPVAQAV